MDKELALRFLPHIYFDEKEPFFPVLVGVTVFDGPGRSPSYNRSFDFSDPMAAKVIEYAIYWDYDIGHLYELEHIWVYVGVDGGLYDAEASFHGRYLKALLPDRRNVEEETHVAVYSQPGKHAFLPDPSMMALLPDLTDAAGKHAGNAGLLQTAPFRGCYQVTQDRHTLVTRYLQDFAFQPSLRFVRRDLPAEILTDWPGLFAAVPLRVEAELERIRRRLEASERAYRSPPPDSRPLRRTVLFLDCGDTLIDEATQVRNALGDVIAAEPIPGAVETVLELYSRGYRMCLVADGKAIDFRNLTILHGIDHCFEAFVISECVREEKPSPRMFRAAMGAMLLTDEDLPRIAMVGNNLRKDVKGANRMGITSVHLRWSPRYLQEPGEPDETPNYTIGRPHELLELAERLERL